MFFSISTKWLSVLKTEWVQQRYVLAFMGLMALVNCFTMRICLSVAINTMTAPPRSNSTTSTSGDYCPIPVKPTTAPGETPAPPPAYDFEWTEAEQGFILSSFYIGYVLTHVPGGIIADRFGGKHTLGLGVLGTAITTLLSPIAARGLGNGGLIAIRILMGLGEGVTFPALNVMLAQWVPLHERGRLGAIVFAGTQVGTLVGNALSGVLLEYYAWDWTFYFFGFLGVLWYIFWSLLCYSYPSEHPFISDKEAKYLHDTVVSGQEHAEKVPTPWKHILTSLPVWGLVISEIGHDWGFFTMVTDLPKFMSNVLYFKISESGFYSALPFLIMWICSVLFGFLADYLTLKGYMSVTNVRKSFTTLASVGPGLFLVVAVYVGCDPAVVVSMFCIGMGTMGAFYPGMRVNALDLSPRHVGTISAIMNGLGAVMGIIAPYIVGIIAVEGKMNEWRTVFWITFAVLTSTNLLFLFMGSGDLQWWDDPNGVPPARRGRVSSSTSQDDPEIRQNVAKRSLEPSAGSANV